MAELSYNDVSRAASEGTRDIWNLLQRLQQQVQQMGNVQQMVMQVNTFYQQAVPDIQRQIKLINVQLDQLNRRAMNSSGTDQRVITLQQDINELKIRFASFERFAQDMSNYFHAEFERQQQEAQNGL